MQLSGRQLTQHVRRPGLHPQNPHTHSPTDMHIHTHTLPNALLQCSIPQVFAQRSLFHDASLECPLLLWNIFIIFCINQTFEERQYDKVLLGTHNGLTLSQALESQAYINIVFKIIKFNKIRRKEECSEIPTTESEAQNVYGKEHVMVLQGRQHKWVWEAVTLTGCWRQMPEQGDLINKWKAKMGSTKNTETSICAKFLSRVLHETVK